MRKFFFCVSLVLTGLMTSCIDKNEEVDADSRPSWLGNSIYAELKNPSAHGLLTGTFTNYVRLIDDLGYDEVLNRTGSKTLFPANDEAFERFFKSNDWGVTRYEDLSTVQKKVLLYGSMIDNSLLLDMLPNVSNGSNEPMKGYGLRHFTNMSIIDSVQYLPGSGSEEVRPEQMPANNSYWKKHYQDGVYVVSDNTQPMMVHLTREYMIHNGITTVGDQSDFAILTGTPFTEGSAYIFNNRVMNGDVTCQNGYIHQMEDVMVAPGNMAQVLRQKSNTKIFSRILDYFSAPYLDEQTTKNYHDWYEEQLKAGIDMTGVPNPANIYQVRYLSNRSQEAVLQADPEGTGVSGSKILSFDPGWNTYFPKPASNSGSVDYKTMDMGAFFVPSDQAVKQYFLPGGAGAYLIDIYGDRENTEANLMENLDSLHSKNAQVLTSFTNNLMKSSFAATVPSKFETVNNDASENMGLTIGLLHRDETTGKYDIRMANNGAIYVLDEFIAPDEYQSVMAPASVYPDMQVMNWMIQDGVKNGDYLGVDFKYYLLAMSANYAFFIPSDEAFDLYYLDPASLGHLDTDNITPRYEVLHFFYDNTATRQPYLACNRHYYYPITGEIDPTASVVNISQVKTQLVDILNYHTVVLGDGEKLCDNGNHYYKTKHGGTIYVDGASVGSHVMSGLQIDNAAQFPTPQITQEFNEKNGVTYKIDRIIQAPNNSVYSVIDGNPQFSKFRAACMGFNATNILQWAGISKNAEKAGMPSPQDAYTIFTHTTKGIDKEGNSADIQFACQDYNVKMFNTYNYTLFAPDNQAMTEAEANGLPTWTEIQALYTKWHSTSEEEEEAEGEEEGEEATTVSAAEQADIVRAYEMIRTLRDFIRYHFITNSIYADQKVIANTYSTLYTTSMGVAEELTISQDAPKTLTVTTANGTRVTIDANDGSKVTNRMTRDIWLGGTDSKGGFSAAAKDKATGILTSSFCAVHQVSTPLFTLGGNTRYDASWTDASAFKKAMKDYKIKKANNEL